MQELEKTPTEELLLRISFLFAGGFLLAEGLQNWIRGKIETHPEVVTILLITYLVAFAALGIGMSDDRVIKKFRHLPLFALVGLLLASGYVISQVNLNGAYGSDSLAFAHYAAILFVKGVNPYGRDLQDALRVFSVDPQFITLTPSGSIVTILNYPALSFLLFVPAVICGVTDMRVVIFLFEIVALLSIYFWADVEIRPIVLLPVFAGADLAINFSSGSIADFLWVLPLIYVVFSLKRPWLAGVFYGLSCAIKQTPWLLAPFLLIWIYSDQVEPTQGERLRRSAGFVVAAAAAFLVPNLWFIYQDYSLWWQGVITPSFGNLVILSQGLSMISEIGYVPLPPHFYLITFIAVFVTLILNYAVYFDKLRHVIWVMPMLTMWFSYRGLQNYFIFWIPLLVTSAIYMYKERIRV
jgi:uncharacterized membrane protein